MGYSINNNLMDIKMLMQLKDNNLIINLENILPTLEPIKELKRLQKEIDEAEEEKTTLTVHSWGGMNQFEKNRFNLCDETVTKNQLKIKQIIESL